MDEPPQGCETVFRTREQRECLESHLVLEAVGISAQVGYRDGWWLLDVDREDTAVAAAELDAYRRENSGRSAHGRTVIPVYGGAASAVAVYAGIIILVASLTIQRTFGLDWFSAGRMQAGQVMSGEWWRTVTALTLHVDAGHIAANLLFGTVFGLLAGRALGGGMAWLAIVAAGALGNFANAMVRAPTHASVGASTAVFAALGIIVAHSLRPWSAVPEKVLKRWSPLIGGGLLLAFTGVGGDRTDVVAHLTGFSAGLLLGWLGCRLPRNWLASQHVQKWAGLMAIAIVTASWIVGLRWLG